MALQCCHLHVMHVLSLILLQLCQSQCPCLGADHQGHEPIVLSGAGAARVGGFPLKQGRGRIQVAPRRQHPADMLGASKVLTPLFGR